MVVPGVIEAKMTKQLVENEEARTLKPHKRYTTRAPEEQSALV